MSSLHNQQAKRDPWRILNIEDPGKYRGQLGDNGSTEQRYSDLVFSVNATVDKVDGNLISEFFIYQIEGNNSIYAGSYPSNSNEVHLIVKQGVQSVLNLQSEEDMEQRQVLFQNMKQIYSQYGITNVVNFPLYDCQEDVYPEQLFEAAK